MIRQKILLMIIFLAVLFMLQNNKIFAGSKLVLNHLSDNEAAPKESLLVNLCEMYWNEEKKAYNGYVIEGVEFGAGFSTDDKGNRVLNSSRTQKLEFNSGEQAVILLHTNVLADNIRLLYVVKWMPKGQQNSPPLEFAYRQGRFLKRGSRTAWYRTRGLLPGCYTLIVFGPGELSLATVKFSVK